MSPIQEAGPNARHRKNFHPVRTAFDVIRQMQQTQQQTLEQLQSLQNLSGTGVPPATVPPQVAPGPAEPGVPAGEPEPEGGDERDWWYQGP